MVSDATMASLLLAFIVLVVVFGPFVLIFGANCILAAMEYKEIPYTLGTWFGSLIIGMTFRGARVK